MQLRAIEERRTYLRELDDRRAKILASLQQQGALTPELAQAIAACTTKAVLEDLYLPYKPKRRTRARMARERGLEPLAKRILDQPRDGNPRAEARAFINAQAGVPDADAALAGARDIAAETVSETAAVRAAVRATFFDHGAIQSRAIKSKTKEPTKFEHYYDFREPARRIPSHRFLAILRGEREGFLRVKVDVDVDRLLGHIERLAGVRAGSPWRHELSTAIADGYKRLLAPSVENELRTHLKERSDIAAVQVFADNLQNLLLAAPLGTKPVVGIDPGQRTGCKCVAVTATGAFVSNTTVYLHRGDSGAAKARTELLGFIRSHNPVAVAVGNGTGGREAEAFVRKLLAEEGLRETFVVQVNESGASIYSASDIAREEFPKLDLTVRGAISIARRLQDPLAELVKLDPKVIGVGQYQHDVHQPLLQRKLGDVVETCVNRVGVDLNTASAPLLSYVAGVSKSVAKNIVAYRDANGGFATRRQLLKVPGLGARTFEQAAGFLRIRGGRSPLDASAVHPERYQLVEQMASDANVAVGELLGNDHLVNRIDVSRYISDEVGEPTLRDIIRELEKPGRDPREEFSPPRFRDDVHGLEDLTEGMTLEGVVTNVTAFGAFVDVGVHQDGLVHISELADRFIKDPNEVVRAGDKLTVRVLGVDLARKRISLSARKDHGDRRPAPRDGRSRPPQRRDGGQRPNKGKGRGRPETRSFTNNPFAKLRRDD